MDATIAGYVQEAGRGVVIAVNKWDLAARQRAEDAGVPEDGPRPPQVPGLGARRLRLGHEREGARHACSRPRERVQEACLRRVTTGAAQPPLADAAQAPRPQGREGSGAVKILFATQIGVAPPTFVISLNHPVGPALLLPPLPREPAPRRLRLRGRPHRPQGPNPQALTHLGGLSLDIASPHSYNGLKSSVVSSCNY